MFVGSWHFVNLGTMSWGFVRWFKESLCPVQPDLLLKLQVKLFQVWPRSVAASLTGSRRMKMVHALSCAFMCFHALSCAFMCFHVLSCALLRDLTFERNRWNEGMIWSRLGIFKATPNPQFAIFWGNQDGSLFYGSTVLPSFFLWIGSLNAAFIPEVHGCEGGRCHQLHSGRPSGWPDPRLHEGVWLQSPEVNLLCKWRKGGKKSKPVEIKLKSYEKKR